MLPCPTHEMRWPVGVLSELSSDRYGTTGNRGNHQGPAEHEPLVMSLLGPCRYSTAPTDADQNYNSGTKTTASASLSDVQLVLVLCYFMPTIIHSGTKYFFKLFV